MKIARQGKRNLVLFNKIDTPSRKSSLEDQENHFYLKYDSSQNLAPYFKSTQPVHSSKLITIKNYNSVKLPGRTVSSPEIQFLESSQMTKRKGNLIVAANVGAEKRGRKDSNLSKLVKKKKNHKKGEKYPLYLGNLKNVSKKKLKRKGRSRLFFKMMQVFH